jgi:hypothetical protein
MRVGMLMRMLTTLTLPSLVDLDRRDALRSPVGCERFSMRCAEIIAYIAMAFVSDMVIRLSGKSDVAQQFDEPMWIHRLDQMLSEAGLSRPGNVRVTAETRQGGQY